MGQHHHSGVLIGGLYAMFAAGLRTDLRGDAARQHAHGDLIVLTAYVAR
jgi:hypothetical protein